jgi:hypothetical protein
MVLLAVGLLFSGSLPVDSIDRLGVAAETLPPIDPLTPTEHGQSPIDGLQYADPTEALGIIGPPVANNEGTAGLSYPIDVPPGHGITPELAVSYDSSGGNSWLGMGWDLSVGAIGVDTSFGAPHFDPDSESESYVHDGDLLVPNAIGGAWEPRVPTTRRDYTHQVETEYAEIIRHVVNDGGPDDYFWEVRGKDGGVKWYGATPDSGGPVPSTTQSVPTIDEDAVVRDADGNIVRWLLSAQRDIGVNLIRYEYETVRYTFSGGAWVVDPTCDATAAVCGQHTYLDRVLYTDATSAITDFNGPPYEIDFIRESEMPGNSGSAAREDPMVNARLGYLDVIVDRLARVEVSYGNPPVTGTTRTYDQTAAGCRRPPRPHPDVPQRPGDAQRQRGRLRDTRRLDQHRRRSFPVVPGRGCRRVDPGRVGDQRRLGQHLHRLQPRRPVEGRLFRRRVRAQRWRHHRHRRVDRPQR